MHHSNNIYNVLSLLVLVLFIPKVDSINLPIIENKPECLLSGDSITRSLYNQDIINERHRHRYEVNNNYIDGLSASGLNIVGKSKDKNLVEVVELAGHPWFVACQFHPEFTSNPREGHPLFSGFVKAAEEWKENE